MIFNLLFLNLVMTPMMGFKPLTFTLYVAFPKFVPRNELSIGSKKINIDSIKEGETVMNIVIYI